jgi:splicing factor 3B subunit 1
MTPILRNRHEKVQEASINLIGRIGEYQSIISFLRSSDLFFLPADLGAEFVPAREWMRICFELLDLLKAHKKGIRRAAVNSFGYIAKSLGPQDVPSILLTNLRVQERQSRVCSTVAIASSRRFVVPSRVSLLFSVNTRQQSLTCAPVV